MFKNKIKYISLLVILFIAVTTNAAIDEPTTNKTTLTDQLDNSYISDGPYIFYEKEKVSVKWIRNNQAFEKK